MAADRFDWLRRSKTVEREHVAMFATASLHWSVPMAPGVSLRDSAARKVWQASSHPRAALAVFSRRESPPSPPSAVRLPTRSLSVSACCITNSCPNSGIPQSAAGSSTATTRARSASIVLLYARARSGKLGSPTTGSAVRVSPSRRSRRPATHRRTGPAGDAIAGTVLADLQSNASNSARTASLTLARTTRETSACGYAVPSACWLCHRNAQARQLCQVPRLQRVGRALKFEQRESIQPREQHGQVAAAGRQVCPVWRRISEYPPATAVCATDTLFTHRVRPSAQPS